MLREQQLKQAMSAGYLYVLINPSMPGLSKVGKTTRAPRDRVAELSAATGVPTPFILAYEQAVCNCHLAEQWVHSKLEENGHRPADNREFFTAPLHEIVRIISETTSLIESRTGDAEEVTDDVPSAAALGQELFDLAFEYSAGSDTRLPDEQKALETLVHAAQLGNKHACELVGLYHLHGICSAPRDLDVALEFYLKAVEGGKLTALVGVAEVFLAANKPETARRYWIQFFEGAKAVITDLEREDPAVSRSIEVEIGRGVIEYCQRVAISGGLKHFIPDETLAALIPCVQVAIERKLQHLKNEVDHEVADFNRDRLQKVVGFINSLSY